MAGPVRSRLVPVLATGLLAGVLAGCGGEPGVEEAGATAPAAVPAAATDPATDLAEGLLPADAFGPGARVVPLTPDLLAGSGLPMGGLPGAGLPTDLTVTPQECADVLATLPTPDGDVPEFAAQVAVTGTSATVQALVAGPATADAVPTLQRAAAACSDATVEAPGHGSGTVVVTPVDLPEELGDDALGLALTATARTPDGRQVTLSGLVGLVPDGDRLVALATGDARGGPVDQAAFGALLTRAYETQAAALD
ncbi:hypothetical protein GCU56_03315 [Geodermatophilus sabuli]|uniref:Sensor domain-containing protein n=1 Tax=Geodermatophilus sabuli TaxID=1564158 RepID=A0A7K3VW79_9ACTN|nr:hypothetical protein [Geodermatophilus sabuli]NEK56899.1 hypothetical protein [Geodermatophilus sabuli]